MADRRSQHLDSSSEDLSVSGSKPFSHVQPQQPSSAVSGSVKIPQSQSATGVGASSTPGSAVSAGGTFDFPPPDPSSPPSSIPTSGAGFPEPQFSSQQPVVLPKGSQPQQQQQTPQKPSAQPSPRQPLVNILDQPLGSGREKMFLSTFAFLFSELVQYSQARVESTNALEERYVLISFTLCSLNSHSIIEFFCTGYRMQAMGSVFVCWNCLFSVNGLIGSISRTWCRC